VLSTLNPPRNRTAASSLLSRLFRRVSHPGRDRREDVVHQGLGGEREGQSREQAKSSPSLPYRSCNAFCSLHLHGSEISVWRRAARRLASVTSWENSKVAEMEAELKKIHVSRMQNQRRCKCNACVVQRNEPCVRTCRNSWR